jgi:two-component system OmpR family response regulator
MTTPPPKSEYLIVLDDDATIQHMVGAFTGIQVLPFATAEGLRANAERYAPVAALVDIYLRNNENGLDLVPELHRLWPHTPILVMTASDSVDLIGAALACGACDFLKKPFTKAELVARLRARVSEHALLRNRTTLNFGNLVLDWHHEILFSGERRIHLSPAAVAVLKLLLETPGQSATKEELMRAAWHGTKVAANTLDAKISEIRKALRSIGATVSIDSHYGKGVGLSNKKEASPREPD